MKPPIKNQFKLLTEFFQQEKFDFAVIGAFALLETLKKFYGTQVFDHSIIRKYFQKYNLEAYYDDIAR
jgi:hypothetical protein